MVKNRSVKADARGHARSAFGGMIYWTVLGGGAWAGSPVRWNQAFVEHPQSEA
jgi:hypothetical protein